MRRGAWPSIDYHSPRYGYDEDRYQCPGGDRGETKGEQSERATPTTTSTTALSCSSRSLTTTTTTKDEWATGSGTVRGNAGRSKSTGRLIDTQPPVNFLADGRPLHTHQWLGHQPPRWPTLSTSKYQYSLWLQTLSASLKVVMLSVDCGLVNRPCFSSRKDPEHLTQCSQNARRRSRVDIVLRTSHGDCGIASWLWPWPHLREDRMRCGV